MATSGTTSFTVSRDDIITEALSLCGVQDPSIPLTAADITTCSTSLNVMCKAMVMDGLPLWAVEEVTVPMILGQASYQLGPTATGAAAGVTSINMTNNGSSGALPLTHIGTDIATGTSPWYIAISPDGANAYVVNQSANTISQYSISGGILTHIGSDVATGTSPRSIVVSPDGLNVYVANYDTVTGNTISQYSRSAGLLTHIGTDIATGTNPQDIEISPDGLNVYVVNFGSNTISQYSRSSGILTHIGTDVATGTQPKSITSSSDGLNVYVSNGAGTISQYSRLGGFLTHIGVDLVASTNSTGIIISPDGNNVYAINSSANTISQYNRTNGILTHIGSDVSTGNNPFYITISPDGANAYVINNADNTISQYSRVNGILTQIGTNIATGTSPWSIDVSPNGANVYVVNNSGTTVSQYSRSFTGGTFQLTFSGGTGNGASGTYTISSSTGQISSTAITTGGSYTVAPTVSFLYGGIMGAIGTAILGTPVGTGIVTDRPLRILQAFIRDSNGNDTILTVESRYEYNINGQKTSQSTPNQLFYDPQLNNGIITVFGTPPDSSSTIHLVIQRQFQDFNLSTDNPDFPQEGYLMLSWGLADMVSLKYRVPRDVRAELAIKAKMFKEQFFSFQQDYVPIQIVPGDSITLDNYSSSY